MNNIGKDNRLHKSQGLMSGDNRKGEREREGEGERK